MRYNSILETIGNTPCVRLNNIAPEQVKLFVKLESFNPTGSLKDRMALGIIETAERNETLRPGQTIVEATSGNGGIGLAMVCAQKGYPLVAVMPENCSVEKRRLMRLMGARVVLTPAEFRGLGAIHKAEELALRHGWYYCRQFENRHNATAHSRTTAREILRDFADLPLDYWVTGYGTGGTLKGVADILKKHSPRTKVVVCEPNNSQLLASAERQPVNDQGAPSMSHPHYGLHVMQGWASDFISELTAQAQHDNAIDILLSVDGKDALAWSRRLASGEGISTGISGGATLAAAMKLAKLADPSSTILCMLPDNAERYFSTALFENVAEDMNQEELELSASTSNFRFDARPSPLPTIEVDEQAPALDDMTQTMFQHFIHNPKRPVVMFGLEWCEFCWSVRKLFGTLSIALTSVDLDAVNLKANRLGEKLKAALVAHTGCNTLPQVFIGGEFLGSCTEIFDAVNNRKLFQKLAAFKIPHNRVLDIDPYALLPGWMHTRIDDNIRTQQREPLDPAHCPYAECENG